MPRVASRPRRRHTAVPLRRLFAPLVAGVLLAAAPLGAQEGILTTPVDSVPLPPVGGASPGGAFLRALTLPGWGHASIGSYHRGAFYFVVEGAAAWNLLRTRRRLEQAKERVEFRESLLRRELADEGVTDPAAIEEALDADDALQDLRSLEESRRQQREDWTALAIFFVFLSGADAYVSAHLRDFPTPLELEARPVGGGRMEFSVGITLPR